VDQGDELVYSTVKRCLLLVGVCGGESIVTLIHDSHHLKTAKGGVISDTSGAKGLLDNVIF